jgi:hypothetical protein
MVQKGFSYALTLRLLASIGEPYRDRALGMMRTLLADADADTETRCLVASELIQLEPERHSDVVRCLMSIIKDRQDPSAQLSAWCELLLLGPDLRHEAQSALLWFADRPSDCVNAFFELGPAFSSSGVADRIAASNVLTTAARDESRAARTRFGAVRGLHRLGRGHHRQAAELAKELIEAGVPIGLTSAASMLADSGRGVRAVLAEALYGVLRDERTSSDRLWSAVQSLGYLGCRVPSEVLRRIVLDEAALFWRRTDSALMLADQDETSLSPVILLLRRGAGEISFRTWQRLAADAVRSGLDVREGLHDIAADPDASHKSRAAVAALLGKAGIPELRAQAEDPYLGLDARSEAYQLLLGADPTSLFQAVSFHRSVMDDPDENVKVRCEMAAGLIRLDRSATSDVLAFLWRCAESPQLNAWERASSAILLVAFDEPASPRLVQLIIGMCRDPAVSERLQARLARWLPFRERIAAADAMLADRLRQLAHRVPVADNWGDRLLIRESEVAVREVLACPMSSEEERREAANELAGLSGKHVPEAVGILLADGSPAALVEAAKLGDWQPVLDRVLDESRPWRERLAIALRLPNMAADAAVRDMLGGRSRMSWRDEIDVLAYLGRFDELRALRDDCAGLLVQRWRAATKLVELTPGDRASAALLYRQIATDLTLRPARRLQAARDLGGLGAHGRAEAEPLMRGMVADEGLPVRVRSNAANWLRNHVRTSQEEMLAIERRLVAPTVVGRIYVLRSISSAPSQEAVDELLALAADPELSPRIRLWCARSVVERRRDLRDRCAMVAKDIAFDIEAPWQIRLRAARCLARWSEVMRADAIALVKGKCAE